LCVHCAGVSQRFRCMLHTRREAPMYLKMVAFIVALVAAFPVAEATNTYDGDGGSCDAMVCVEEPACMNRADAVCFALLTHCEESPAYAYAGDRGRAFDTCVEVVEAAHSIGFRDPWDRVIAAQAYHESRLDPDAIGPAGEIGPLQIMTRYHCPSSGSECDPVLVAVRLVGSLRDAAPTMSEALARYNGVGTPSDGAFDYAADIRSTATSIREVIEREGWAICDVQGGAR
jgi:hypothetical protein